ncbi:MAG: hypothetical protein HY720_22280 [Planctomycetes bacterium]|nr:hypothetical protein [Planctomycetota bacterium]
MLLHALPQPPVVTVTVTVTVTVHGHGPRSRSTEDRPVSRTRRIAAFLAAMFPPWLMVPFALANFLALHFALQAMADIAPLAITWRSGLAAASFVLFPLLLRVYDEEKDVSTDLALARAGDPRYANRPIATGKVTTGDLKVLRLATIVLLFAANLPLGFPLPFAAFAAAFALAWLSSKWFFYPSMSENLLLAFATHNPLSLVFGGYVVAVFAAEFDPSGLSGWTALLLVGLWMPVAAWETSRKVRLPQDETDYRTYSKVLGWKTATVLPALFVTASAASLAGIARRIGLGWPFLAALGAAAAFPVGASLLLRFAPTRARANLRPWAEVYAVAANAGLAIALGVSRGVALR